jgi:hypothetical protein
MKLRTPVLLACGSALLVSACQDIYPPPPPPRGPARDAHIDWCLRHRFNYNPHNNVYQGSDGSPHLCVTPWEK